LPDLARQLDVARSVLADLMSGGMHAPVGRRLVDALTHAPAITEDAFQSAWRTRSGECSGQWAAARRV
jgi:hypothetical protein